MAGLYYEEFTVGRAFDHAWTRTVTETDNVLYSSLTMNVQPLHLDEEFASKTEFGQRIVNSLFTLGLMIGITVNDTTIGTTIANLGMRSSSTMSKRRVSMAAGRKDLPTARPTRWRTMRASTMRISIE